MNTEFNSENSDIRLKESYDYTRSQGLIHTKKEFANAIGWKPTHLSSAFGGDRTRLTRGLMEAIANAFPQINLNWLLTGEGEMLKSDYKVDEISIPTEEELVKISEMKGHWVPLIPTAALANSLSEYLGPGIRRSDCQNILSAVPGADFAITISGDSMEPKFHDGMIVFLKRINGASFIPWGNTLVLDTENGAFIKNVFPCEDDDSKIEARSLNPKYPVMKIPKESIFGMYRVLNATKFYTTM